MKSSWRTRFSHQAASKERFTLLQCCKDSYSLQRGALGPRNHSYTLNIDNKSPFSRYIAALDDLLDAVIAALEKETTCKYEPSRVMNICQAMINNVVWLLNNRVAILYRGNNEKSITDVERIAFICMYHDIYQTMSIFYNAVVKSVPSKGSSVNTQSNAYSYQHKWLISSLKSHLNYSFPRLLYRVTSYYSTVVKAMVTKNVTTNSLHRFLYSNEVLPHIDDYETCVIENYNPSKETVHSILSTVIQGILDPLYKLLQTFTTTACNSPSSKHQQIILPCCIYLMSTTITSVIEQLLHIIYSEKCPINANGVRNLFIFLLNLKSWLIVMKRGLGIGVDTAVIADMAPWRTANSVIQLLQFQSRIKVTSSSIWRCCTDSSSAIHTTEDTSDERKTEEIDDFTSNYDLNIKPTEKISWVKLRKGSNWQSSSKSEKVAVLFVVDVLNL